MKNVLADVKAFHEACDVPILATPTLPEERLKLRMDILEEEVREFREAIEARDIVQTADALADIIYVAAGAALEFGIPLERVWAEVHRSNMAKRDPETGKVRRRDDGKVLKPEGWTGPDIATAISAI
jgi:predicted HAD superfamily Cof-like phosphohydrolase